MQQCHFCMYIYYMYVCCNACMAGNMNYIIIGGAAWAALEHIDIIGDREMAELEA